MKLRRQRITRARQARLTRRTTRPDIHVAGNGVGFFTFTGKSRRGRLWLEANVDIATWQRTSNRFHCDDTRLAYAISRAAMTAGLQVRGGRS